MRCCSIRFLSFFWLIYHLPGYWKESKNVHEGDRVALMVWWGHEETARQKQGKYSLSRIKRSVFQVMNADIEINMFCRDNVDVLRAQGMSIAPFDGMDEDDFHTSGWCQCSYELKQQLYTICGFILQTPIIHVHFLHCHACWDAIETRCLVSSSFRPQVPTNQIIPSSLPNAQ